MNRFSLREDVILAKKFFIPLGKGTSRDFQHLSECSELAGISSCVVSLLLFANHAWSWCSVSIVGEASREIASRDRLAVHREKTRHRRCVTPSAMLLLSRVTIGGETKTDALHRLGHELACSWPCENARDVLQLDFVPRRNASREEMRSDRLARNEQRLITI